MSVSKPKTVFAKHFRSEHYKIKQLIPATGWRMLLAWTVEEEGGKDAVYTALTHLAAWALIVPKSEDYGDDNEVVPVIPDPSDRTFTFDFSALGLASVLVQPGSEPTTDQDAFVREYAQEIRAEETAYRAACKKARELRRSNTSFESIAEMTGLTKHDARRIASYVDEAMAREKRAAQ